MLLRAALLDANYRLRMEIAHRLRDAVVPQHAVAVAIIFQKGMHREANFAAWWQDVPGQ
jgi:hypothetical protein